MSNVYQNSLDLASRVVLSSTIIISHLEYSYDVLKGFFVIRHPTYCPKVSQWLLPAHKIKQMIVFGF
jgi:hypothetical protein